VVHISTYKSAGYDLLARICSAVRALVYGAANYHGGSRSFESPRPHDSFKNT
jgi:hypothetical protein